MRQQLGRELQFRLQPPGGVNAELAKIAADPIVALSKKIVVARIDQTLHDEAMQLHFPVQEFHRMRESWRQTSQGQQNDRQQHLAKKVPNEWLSVMKRGVASAAQRHDSPTWPFGQRFPRETQNNSSAARIRL
ncbi:MAG TPA: hypothetical protein PLB97_10630 [Accumulibacter sp.]|nr:hypothetical protein [Accumulibacter sp.]HPP46978.1 hypothetical protein [Accumulibacter sp.]